MLGLYVAAWQPAMSSAVGPQGLEGAHAYGMCQILASHLTYTVIRPSLYAFS